MSRVGRSPIPVPSGVEVTIDDRHVTVKGPKGTLERDIAETITVRREGEELLVERPDDERENRALHGLTRSLLANKTRPLRQEVQQIDTRMEKLAAEKAQIEALLATGKRPPAEMADAGRRLNHIAAEVAMLEERWLELQAEIETLTAAG